MAWRPRSVDVGLHTYLPHAARLGHLKLSLVIRWNFCGTYASIATLCVSGESSRCCSGDTWRRWNADTYLWSTGRSTLRYVALGSTWCSENCRARFASMSAPKCSGLLALPVPLAAPFLLPPLALGARQPESYAALVRVEALRLLDAVLLLAQLLVVGRVAVFSSNDVQTGRDTQREQRVRSFT